MNELARILNPEDFIDPPTNDLAVIVSWSFTWSRIKVSLCGLDVYLQLTETAVDALEEEYGTPNLECDDIDVPTYHQLNEAI